MDANFSKRQTLKKTADEIMKIPGLTKGSEIQTLASYLREKYGEKSLKLLEKEIAGLGYSLRFEKIDEMKWYPEALNVLAIVAAKKIFGWTDKDIFEFGNASPKFSFGVRLFLKMSSLRRVFKEISEYWKKFVDVGNLEPIEYNEKEGYLIVRLKNYNFHPDMCPYFAGFFLRIAQYTLRSKDITIKETKCPHKRGPYHEYLIQWK